MVTPAKLFYMLFRLIESSEQFKLCNYNPYLGIFLSNCYGNIIINSGWGGIHLNNEVIPRSGPLKFEWFYYRTAVSFNNNSAIESVTALVNCA